MRSFQIKKIFENQARLSAPFLASTRSGPARRKRAVLESQGRVNPAVRGHVVVGVAVVVDNAHVGGGLALCGRLPPVAAATTTTVYQRITNTKIKVFDP